MGDPWGLGGRGLRSTCTGLAACSLAVSRGMRPEHPFRGRSTGLQQDRPRSPRVDWHATAARDRELRVTRPSTATLPPADTPFRLPPAPSLPNPSSFSSLSPNEPIRVCELKDPNWCVLTTERPHPTPKKNWTAELWCRRVNRSLNLRQRELTPVGGHYVDAPVGSFQKPPLTRDYEIDPSNVRGGRSLAWPRRRCQGGLG